MIDQANSVSAPGSCAAPRTLALAEANDRHRRRYLWAIGAIAALGTVLLPFARLPLPAVPEFNIVYVTGVLFGDLATAFLLFAQFRASGRASLIVLGAAYLFTATIVIPHLLYFSEFAPRVGWFAGAPQTAAWLWHAWHLAFPLSVLGYVAVERWGGELSFRRRAMPLGITVAGVVALSFGLTLAFTAFEGHLPQLHDGRVWNPITFQLGWTMGLATVAALVGVMTLPNRHRVLHLWLSVALVAFLFDIVPNMIALERFAFGWYAGRVSGLLAATFLFVMLLRETSSLYVSLGAALDEAADLNVALERRVDERTAELRALNTSLDGAVKQRDLLLSEVYHRVNNNLQGVSSMLLMESKRLGEGPGCAAMLRMARRARAMGLVHQQIMGSNQLDSVDLHRLLHDLARNLRDSLGMDNRGLVLDVEADAMTADIDFAMSIGLIVNELVSNAVEHAYEGRPSGRVVIGLRRENGMLRLEVADDGVGIKAAPEGLGSRIVAGLVAQANGRQETFEEGGTRRCFLFPTSGGAV